MLPIGLVYSIHDPTEVAIQKMIEASQRMIMMNSQEGEGREGGEVVIKGQDRDRLHSMRHNERRTFRSMRRRR
jgi:hypothetical protein